MRTRRQIKSGESVKTREQSPRGDDTRIRPQEWSLGVVVGGVGEQASLIVDGLKRIQGAGCLSVKERAWRGCEGAIQLTQGAVWD